MSCGLPAALSAYLAGLSDRERDMNDFVTSWVHHWGWLWMVIGLLGNVVIVVLLDD